MSARIALVAIDEKAATFKHRTAIKATIASEMMSSTKV